MKLKAENDESPRSVERIRAEKEKLLNEGIKRGVVKRVTIKKLKGRLLKTEVENKTETKRLPREDEFEGHNRYPIKETTLMEIKKEMFKYGPYLSSCKNCNSRNEEFFRVKRPRDVNNLLDYMDSKGRMVQTTI